MPPGFTKQMFQEIRLAPNVRPLVQDVIGDVGQRAVAAPRHGRHRAAHRLRERRQPVPGPRRRAAAGAGDSCGARRAAAAHRLGTALGKPDAQPARRRVRAGARLRRDPWPGRARAAAACRGFRRLASIRWSCSSRWPSRCSPACSSGCCRWRGSPPRGWRRRSTRAAALGTASRQRHRARNSLVVAEIALAVVLLVASGLMIRTFQAMRHVDPGFRDPAQVVSLRISIPETMIKDPDAGGADARADRAPARADSRRAVGRAHLVGPDGRERRARSDLRRGLPGPGRADSADPQVTRWSRTATSGRWATGLIAGRTLTWADSFTQAAGRRGQREPGAGVLEGSRPRRSAAASATRPDNAWRTIVGVIGDERDEGLAKPATPIVYWPLRDAEVLERGDQRPAQRRPTCSAPNGAKSPTLLKEIQQAVWSVNGGLPVANVRTLARSCPRRWPRPRSR